MALENTEITWSLLVLLGCLSGFLSGLLGIGGGMILIPTLIISLPYLGVAGPEATRIAMATSLAVIVPTSIASAQMHALKGSVDWRLLLLFGPSIVAGASLAPALAAEVSGPGLTGLFVVFALYTAWGAMRGGRPAAKDARVGRPRYAPIRMAVSGLIGGAFSALLGLGVAFFSVPVLARFIPVQRAIGTAAALGLPMATAGAIGYLLGPTPAECRWGCAGFIYLPAVAAIGISAVLAAPIGARLTHVLPVICLRRLFGVFLITAAGYLTYKTLPIVSTVRASQQIIAGWLAAPVQLMPVAADAPRWLAGPNGERGLTSTAHLGPRRVRPARAETTTARLSAERLLFLAAAAAANPSSRRAHAEDPAANTLLPDTIDAGPVPMPERALRRAQPRLRDKPQVGEHRTQERERTITIALPEKSPSCRSEPATTNTQHKGPLPIRANCLGDRTAPAEPAPEAFNPFGLSVTQ